jgi:hypothetical protein
MITNLNPEDGGSTASETSDSDNQITRRNNTEIHDFYKASRLSLMR